MRIEVELPHSLAAYLQHVAAEDGVTVGDVVVEMAAHFVTPDEAALHLEPEGEEH